MSSKLLLLMALLLFSTQIYAYNPSVYEYVEECKMPTLSNIDLDRDLEGQCRNLEKAAEAGRDMKERDNCAWPLLSFDAEMLHSIHIMASKHEEKKIADQCNIANQIVNAKYSGCSFTGAITDRSSSDGSSCELPGSFESYCEGELACLAHIWRMHYQGEGCTKVLGSVNFHIKHYVKLKLEEYNTDKIPAKCQAVIDDSAGTIRFEYMADRKICRPEMENMNTFSEDENKMLADCPSLLISDNQTAQCVLAGCKMDVLSKRMTPQCFPLIVAMNKEHFEIMGWDSNKACKQIVDSNGTQLEFKEFTEGKRPSDCALEFQAIKTKSEDVTSKSDDVTSKSDDANTCNNVVATHGIVDKATQQCIRISCALFDAQKDIGVCHQSVFADLKKFIDETGLKSNEACVQFVDSDGTDVNFTKFEPIEHRYAPKIEAAFGNFTEADNKTMKNCPSKLLQFTDKEAADCVDAACAMSIIQKYIDKDYFAVLVGIKKVAFENASIDSNTVCQEIIHSKGQNLTFKHLTNGTRPSDCDRERKDYINKKLNGSQGFHDCVQVIETHGILDSNTRTCIEHSCEFFDMQNRTNTVCRMYDFENWKGEIKIKGLESNEACVHFIKSSGTDVNFTKFEPLDHRCRRQLADADGNFTNEDRQTMEDCPSMLLRLTDDQETAECVNAACTMTITPKYMDLDCFPVLVDIQKDAFENASIDSNTVCTEIIESNGTTLDFSSLTDGKTLDDCSKEVADAQKKLTSEDNISIKQCNDVLSTHSFTDDKTKECIRFGCYAQLRVQYVNKTCLPVMFNGWKTNFEKQGLTSNPACTQFTQSNGTDVDFEKFGTNIEKAANKMDESKTTTAMNGHSSSPVSWTVTLALSAIYAVLNIAT